MDQETFNLSIRKFLKMVGVNSQREIEQAVQKAIMSGRLQGAETLAAKCTLDCGSCLNQVSSFREAKNVHLSVGTEKLMSSLSLEGSLSGCARRGRP